jgi:HEAT repeat protein
MGEVDLLIEATKKRDNEVRAGAMRWLSQMKDERLLPLFVAALQDRDQGVRSYTVWGLKRIGGPAAKEALRKHGVTK